MHERFRRILLSRWARLITGHPWITMLLCAALAGGSVVYAVGQLEFKPDRSDLVDADLDWNQRYAEHKQQFPRWNDLIVCLAGEPERTDIDALARTIATELRARERVTSADAGFSTDEASPRMFRAAEPGQFERTLEQLRELRTLVERAPNANAHLAMMTQRLRAAEENDAGGSDRLEQLRMVLTPYLEGLYDNEVTFEHLRVDDRLNRWKPLVSDSGRIRFVQVQFAEQRGAVNVVGDNVAWLRGQVGRIIEQSDVRHLDWGVTGIPAIESDETEQSIHDSTVASILAFVLITVLMVGVFRGVAMPLIAAFTLLIGIAWSFGWLMIAIGHLQLLSVVFAVILLGLGVDFSLHLIGRLELLRNAFDDLPHAMDRAFQAVGPGVVTGALTTAAAFGATALTDFRGMAEMGVIAAGGVVLCLLATLLVLPAGLAIVNWKRVMRARPGGETAHFAHGRLDRLDANPKLMIGLCLAVLAALVWPALSVQYDPNVLKLHPPGIESVKWERRIVEDGARSVWSGVSHTSAEEAPHLADAFRALPEVSGVGGMGTLYPADRLQRREQVEALRQRDIEPIDAEANWQTMIQQLALIQRGLQQRIQQAGDDAPQALVALNEDMQRGFRNWNDLSDDARAQRSQRIEHAYQDARAPLRTYLQEALKPGPLGAEDLPSVLRAQWVGTDGRWLMMVFPADDPQGRSVLHPQRLEQFVSAMRTVDSQVLGPPVQIYESSELIQREYIKAAVYAVAAILLILLLDFQSLADALCAMLPVSVGFLGVFAMMGVFGVPLNFANIIVMPLIFGIGVDAGVHMVHRWRVEPLGRPAGLSGATGRGITITLLTTMIGFGCMLTAQHRGIRSLGFVMVVGLAITLLACYAALPAVLRLRTTHAMVRAAAESEARR